MTTMDMDDVPPPSDDDAPGAVRAVAPRSTTAPATVQPARGELVRETATGTEIDRPAETSAIASAARARAEIEAAYVMAQRRPRNYDVVRVSILSHCKRKGFAEKAWFKRKAGRKFNEETRRWEDNFAEGFSIRFAEQASQSLGNMIMTTTVTYEDADKRHLRMAVVDLEANIVWARDVVLEKTVERRQLRKNEQPLRTRINSEGATTYICVATEDEMQSRTGAEASKRLRTDILRLIPADIKEEAAAMIAETKRAAIAADPEGERKRLIDAFVSIGVKPDRLREHVGQELDSLSPEQIVELRAVFVAIKEGHMTWAEVIEGAEVPAEAKAKVAAKRPTLDDAAAKAKTAREGSSVQPQQSEPTRSVMDFWLANPMTSRAEVERLVAAGELRGPVPEKGKGAHPGDPDAPPPAPLTTEQLRAKVTALAKQASVSIKLDVLAKYKRKSVEEMTDADLGDAITWLSDLNR